MFQGMGKGLKPFLFKRKGGNVYRGESKYFKVVRNIKENYYVWHVDAQVNSPWKETGQLGSENECWDYVETTEGLQGLLFRFQPGD